jgi:hypothetical protein
VITVVEYDPAWWTIAHPNDLQPAQPANVAKRTATGNSRSWM